MNTPIITSDTYRREAFHGVHRAEVRWRVTEEGAIELSPDHGMIRRTPGKPITVNRIYVEDSKSFLEAEMTDAVLKETLIAVCATESRGNWNAERYEQHLRDWSYGGMQILTATASAVNRHLRLEGCPESSIPGRSEHEANNGTAWKAFLSKSSNSIALAARYLAQLNDHWDCNSDPILLYCCYNAGGLYLADNPWGLRHTKGSLERFVAWYNDCGELT
jgi:hypothetical protein